MEASRSQLITSWSSVSVALFALMLAIYSARQTRNTTHLSVRPYVQLSFAFTDHGAGWRYRNLGLGPGLVESFEVSLDGQRLRTWNDLYKKLGLTGPMTFSVPGPGNMSVPYKTGDDTEVFWVTPADSDKLTSSAQRVQINTCYCSLYEDCWTSHFSRESPDSVPEEVSSCKVIPPEERFGVEMSTR